MRDNSRKSAVRRLALIEGQVRGISKMVNEDRYCVDVLRQLHAAKAALASLEQLVLEDHIDGCVSEALASNDLATRQAKVEELVTVLGQRRV